MSLTLVCCTCKRGRNPSWITCLVTLKAPEIKACEAITVAAVARITRGSNAQSGAIMKNGFFTASGLLSSKAPCPK